MRTNTKKPTLVNSILGKSIFSALIGFTVLLCTCASNAQTISILPKTPTNPVKIISGKSVLYPIEGFGPIFLVNGSEIGPGDYKVSVITKTPVPKGMRLTCNATSGTWSAKYILTITQPSAGKITIALTSDTPATGSTPGKFSNGGLAIKQFYTGERVTESYAMESASHVVYVPTAGIYLRGAWDLDVSNAARISTLSVFHNLKAVGVPIAPNMAYQSGIQGPMPKLRELFVLTVSKNLWSAYELLTQKPSEYRSQIGKMVYIDLWHHEIPIQERFIKWLNIATANKVPFVTIVQVWGERGFDGTLPDLFRIPDHMKQQNSTIEELKSLVDTCKSMGLGGLRDNYQLATDYSWSIKENILGKGKDAANGDLWETDHSKLLPLIKRQEKDIKTYFNDTARFSDQLTSGGDGWPYIQFQADYKRRATISGARQSLKEFCRAIKDTVKGPLLSETMNQEFLAGEFVDSADFGIFAGHQRTDFSPDYKLRFLQPKSAYHSMGLGHRFFEMPSTTDWFGKGMTEYFGAQEDQDDYRTCEVLYGNGGYIFWYPGYTKSRAITEVLTLGVAQPYYTLATLDYVKYGSASEWKTLEQLIPKVETTDELHTWFTRFHIRFKNGCHIWVNRNADTFSVRLPDGSMLELPQYSYVIYTEDNNLLCYSALARDTVVSGAVHRIDFCQDKKRGIKFINPRNPNGEIMGASIPTLWVSGKIAYELTKDGPSGE